MGLACGHVTEKLPYFLVSLWRDMRSRKRKSMGQPRAQGPFRSHSNLYALAKKMAVLSAGQIILNNTGCNGLLRGIFV